MRQLSVEEIKRSNIFKNYRTVRKWAVAYLGVTSADFDVLVSLYHREFFTDTEFTEAEYSSNWHTNRLKDFRDMGYVEIHKKEVMGRGGSKRIYKLSRKAKMMIEKFIKILLGQEDIPMNSNNPFYASESYTEKVMVTDMHRINKENRKNR